MTTITPGSPVPYNAVIVFIKYYILIMHHSWHVLFTYYFCQPTKNEAARLVAMHMPRNLPLASLSNEDDPVPHKYVIASLITEVVFQYCSVSEISTITDADTISALCTYIVVLELEEEIISWKRTSFIVIETL